MKDIFYWIGVIYVFLISLGVMVAIIYIFLEYIVTKIGDNEKLFNYLRHKKDFEYWYNEIKQK